MSLLLNLREFEASVYSQCGEDGVLERLFEVIGTTNRYFVEFGAKDGLDGSNSANLRINHDWTGLLMEGSAAHSDPSGRPLVRQAFVTAENVNLLFARYGVPASFDLLSIDIDGNDYWVWKAIEDYRPRVVVVEYNIFFDLHVAKTVPYDPERVWDETTYHGASLAALRKLGEQKGYALVHTDSWAPNAFFVAREALPPDHPNLSIEYVTNWGWFDEPPDARDRPWVSV